MPRRARRPSIPSVEQFSQLDKRPSGSAYEQVVLHGRLRPGSIARARNSQVRPVVDGSNPDERLRPDAPELYTGTPSDFTEIPTSTTNPARPRTLRAGYDSKTKTLTVMFRDGTPWNYYEVSPLQAANFHRAKSKGRFIRQYLDNHPYGPPRSF